MYIQIGKKNKLSKHIDIKSECNRCRGERLRSPQKNIEIERKWLIQKNSLPKNYNKYPNFIIEQAYLTKEPSVRVRKNGNDYFLTIKS